MSKTVVGVFADQDSAQRAVEVLRNSGFGTNEISIVAREGNQRGRKATMGTGNDISGGVTTGGVLGGLAGLAAGAGALAIPGIGPLVAAGPIAGLLSGAATGGIAGGLVDWGIPQERGRYFEGKVREGKILATVRAEDNKVDRAAQILRDKGATDVETH